MSDHLKLDNYSRPTLNMPKENSSLLLHSCCAPCAGEIMEALAASKIKTTVYFYNPNIHPTEEYEIRKNEKNTNSIYRHFYLYNMKITIILKTILATFSSKHNQSIEN